MAQSREQEILAKATPRPWQEGDFYWIENHALVLLAVNSYEADQELIRKLTEALANMECGECGHKMHRHLDKYGCEYDRGDGYIGGSEVLQALGPCGCKCTNSYLECERQAIEALKDAKKARE